MARPRKEPHRIKTLGWLRAAVLGANDGIISTASIILGVASAHAARGSILITGVSGLVAGAMSMAAGEYVSVYSQADTEKAALSEESLELATDSSSEHRELAAIYVRRGLNQALAKQVADQLMAHDALGAHARDELGITEISTPHPLQAALASATSFISGAALPLIAAAVASDSQLIPGVATATLVSLAILGGVSAKTGGANILRGVLRVTFWGALAMLVTSGVGAWFGAPA